MKFRIKIRVANEGTSPQKFSMNLEEGGTFTVSDSVPGIKGEVCTFQIRDASLLVKKVENGPPVRVNGVEGREFRVKIGDVLRSGSISIEFLDVPWRAEAPAETQFIDVASAGLSNALAAAQSGASAEGSSESAPQAARVTNEMELKPEERSHSVTLSVPERPAKTDFYDEGTGTRVRREEVMKELTIEEPSASRFVEAPSRREHRRHSPMAESTRVFLRKTEETESVRKEIWSLSGLLFLAIGVAGGASRLGSPLVWGGAGLLFALGFSALLRRFGGYLGSRAQFREYLRFMTYTYFALIPWGFAFRLHPIAGAVASLVATGAFTYAFMARFRIRFPRFVAVGGIVSILPMVFSAFQITNGFQSLPFGVQFTVTSNATGEAENSGAAEGSVPVARQPASDQQAPPVQQPVAPAGGTQPVAFSQDPAVQPAQPAAVQQPVVAGQAPAQPLDPPAQPIQQYQPPVAQQQQPVQQYQQPQPQLQQPPVQPALGAQASVPQPELAQRPSYEAPAPQLPVQRVAAQHGFQSREQVADPLATEEFFSAAKRGNLSVVKSLIARKAVDPNFTLDKGNTVLMYASAYGQAHIVKYLLSLRVNPNARDPNGTTALMWAVYKGHSEVVKLLMKARADVTIRRDDGDRAIDIAKRWKRWDIADLLSGQSSSSMANTRSGTRERVPASSGVRRKGKPAKRQTYRAIR